MVIKDLKQFVNLGTLAEDSRAGTPYYFDEERIPINYSRLVPGYFYTFTSIRSVNETEIPSLDHYQTTSKAVKPYFDRKPIILSLGQEGPMEVGLNLKLMPVVFRKWFLRKYLNFVMPTLEKLIDQSEEFVGLNARMKMQQSSPFYQINRNFAKLATEQSGFNVEFLVDKYTRSEMGNPLSLIDWQFVPSLCLFEYRADGSIMSNTPISYFWQKF